MVSRGTLQHLITVFSIVAIWGPLGLTVAGGLSACGGDSGETSDTAVGDIGVRADSAPDDTVAPDAADTDALQDTGDVGLSDADPSDSGASDSAPSDSDTGGGGDIDTGEATEDDTEDDTDGDTTAVERCGDGEPDLGEECDLGAGVDGNSDTIPDRCRTDCRNPGCGDGVVDSGEACDDGDEDDYDGCTATCVVGANIPVPMVAGDVVITEVMVNPDATVDIDGEWFELLNATGGPINLNGCVIHDDGTDGFVMGGDGGGVLLEAGEYWVVAANADPARNGGLNPNYTYATMLMDNSSDEVQLSCGDMVVDRVAWDASSWPLISGKSLSLDPMRLGALSNDVAASWCGAQTAYGDGDEGTPGTENPACFHLDTTVDYCVLTTAEAIAGFTDYPLGVTALVGEFGVTNLTDGVDISPNLYVELGYGPAGSVPTDDSWVFAPATAQSGWSDPLRDGYGLDLILTDPGQWRVAARASRDGRSTWAYCGLTGWGEAFALADAAELTVIPSPCDVDVCTSPSPAVCLPDGLHLSSFEGVGACLPTAADAFDCRYAPVLTDCGATAQICESGGCGAVAQAPEDAGSLWLTEVFVTPGLIEPDDGQWFELKNGGAAPVNLQGCAFSVGGETQGDANQTWTVDAPLVVVPGGLAVFGRSADPAVNGGVPVNRAYGAALIFPQAGGFRLSLSCGGVLMDEIAPGLGWPLVAGASANLSVWDDDADANDDGASWCLSTSSFGFGDRGTPGVVNSECPGDVVPVVACGFVSDEALAVTAGVEFTVAVGINAPPSTGTSLRTDVLPAVVVTVGLARPEEGVDGVARWVEAAGDLAWIALPSQGADAADDRYDATLDGPAPGDWEGWIRVTADGGNTWAICDAVGVVSGASASPLNIHSAASACYPSPCGAEPGDVCEPGAVGGGVETVITHQTGPARCALDASGGAVCEWYEAFVEDCALAGAECLAGECTNFPMEPGQGQVVISELMIIPVKGALGQWIELSNPGPVPMELSGCVVVSGAAGSGGGEEVWAFPEAASATEWVIAPGAALVIARSGSPSLNQGANPRAVYEGLALDGQSDWVALECAGRAVDHVAWGVEDGWQIPVFEPLALGGNRLDAQVNDFSEQWCAQAQTPNRINPLCPAPDALLDDCVIVPGTVSGWDAGAAMTFSARLLDVGVTDVQTTSDVAPGLRAEIGIGPRGSDPAVGAAWTWFPAGADLAWDTADAQGQGWAGWDQWRADVVLGEAGDFDVAARFVLADDGEAANLSWLYCDADGGSYQVDAAVQVSLAPTVCVPNPCVAAPAAYCEGNVMIAGLGEANAEGDGVCAVDAGTGDAVCGWQEVSFSCLSFGGCDPASGRCAVDVQRPSQAGELVITEVMRDSLLGAPDFGEWFEIYNTTGAGLDLAGCEVSALDGGEGFSVVSPVPVLIGAGSYFVFAGSVNGADNGGLTGADYAFEGFHLPNIEGGMIVTCDGIEIDRVAYGWDWPGSEGVSMQLSNDALSPISNDAAQSWCDGSTAYGGGHRGTPGWVNRVCPAP